MCGSGFRFFSIWVVAHVPKKHWASIKFTNSEWCVVIVAPLRQGAVVVPAEWLVRIYARDCDYNDDDDGESTENVRAPLTPFVYTPTAAKWKGKRIGNHSHFTFYIWCSTWRETYYIDSFHLTTTTFLEVKLFLSINTTFMSFAAFLIHS